MQWMVGLVVSIHTPTAGPPSVNLVNNGSCDTDGSRYLSQFCCYKQCNIDCACIQKCGDCRLVIKFLCLTNNHFLSIAMTITCVTVFKSS